MGSTLLPLQHAGGRRREVSGYRGERSCPPQVDQNLPPPGRAWRDSLAEVGVGSPGDGGCLPLDISVPMSCSLGPPPLHTPLQPASPEALLRHLCWHTAKLPVGHVAWPPLSQPGKEPALPGQARDWAPSPSGCGPGFLQSKQGSHLRCQFLTSARQILEHFPTKSNVKRKRKQCLHMVSVPGRSSDKGST